ncbi:tetratricopeptide repeat protein [Neorhodopirellula pilleata]|uniref:Tetratricopeptide repeat protein n=1 Tax=Neorhodopirellula pilleata TaxID=2714738 RepID=A0A5C6AUN6_9BACT|nr:tetratricopeptide repeat protein [Neorhodopirellula pilleata]TWU03151.1 Tetratricopeptide repeat protein [Neorhodopirellula pilleata]
MKSHQRDQPRKSPNQTDANDRSLSEEVHGTDRLSDLGRVPFLAALIGIVILAWIVRAIHVWQTADVPTVRFLLGDAAGYFAWATRIASGNWYGDETFYQAPLYPYFLAVCIKYLGLSVPGIRLIQAFLGSLGVGLIGLTAGGMFGRKSGLIAAVMLAFYPPAIFYDGILQKASLVGFLVCLLLTATVWMQRKRTVWSSTGIGIVLGFLVLARENALLWIPLYPVWMLWPGPETNTKKRILLTSAYAFGLSMILLPVAARNASLGGEWSPTTFQAGPNFYIGNNRQSDGIYRPIVPGHETPIYERSDAVRIAEATLGQELSAREVSQFWMGEAFKEMGADPGRWVQLMIQKSFMLINRFEVPDVESLEVYRASSALLQLNLVWNFGILCPLAMWGLMTTFDEAKREGRKHDLIFHALILVMAAAVVLFFILGRYRFAMVPLLIPFAAKGSIAIYHCVRSRSLSGCRKPLAISLLLLVACNLPVHDENGLNASSLMNAGVAAGQSGELAMAIELLERSVALQPGFAETHLNLGRAWQLAGDLDRAIAAYRKASRISPELTLAALSLGQVYEMKGQYDIAIDYYQNCLRLDPTGPESETASARLQDLTNRGENGTSSTKVPALIPPN